MNGGSSLFLLLLRGFKAKKRLPFFRRLDCRRGLSVRMPFLGSLFCRMTMSLFEADKSMQIAPWFKSYSTSLPLMLPGDMDFLSPRASMSSSSRSPAFDPPLFERLKHSRGRRRDRSPREMVELSDLLSSMDTLSGIWLAIFFSGLPGKDRRGSGRLECFDVLEESRCIRSIPRLELPLFRVSLGLLSRVI